MKKKSLSLSCLMVVFALFATLGFTSCNKNDVDFDDLNAPTYVVTPDGPAKAGESYKCPFCGALISPGNACVHYYGPEDDCGWLECPYHNSHIRHSHVFDVCSWGHAEHYHRGGGTSNPGHTH